MGTETKLIAGRQIPVASHISQRLDKLLESISGLQREASEAGLNADSEALTALRSHGIAVSMALEMKARGSFVAARRGIELPK